MSPTRGRGPDLYRRLGVEADADDDELKRAFRALAQQYHPDKNPGDAAAEEAFKDINEAYTILSDPTRRAAYDRTVRSYLRAARARRKPGGLLETIEDIVSDILGNKPKHERARPEGGRDLRFTLELSFEEALLGADREIDLPTRVQCDLCRGTGEAKQAMLCGRCDGRGTVPAQRTLVVRIPPGTLDGAVKRMRGEGEAGGKGYQPGDLNVRVRVLEHPFFRIEGKVLQCDVPIGIAVAALGGEVDVPTVAGKVRMRIPPGTESGRVFRLKGKGMPGKDGRGDQHVRVVVETPTGELGEEVRRAFAVIEAAGVQPKVAAFTAETSKRSKEP